jgi:hypothetical protein
LGPIINDDSIQDPKPADDGLDKLGNKFFVDLEGGILSMAMVT